MLISEKNLGFRGVYRCISIKLPIWEENHKNDLIIYRLFGIPIYRKYWRKFYADKNILDMPDNVNLAQIFRKSGSKRILYVFDNLQTIGGTETRLLKTVRYLEEHGWSVAFLCAYNRYPPLANQLTFTLEANAPNAKTFFEQIISIAQPTVVEFICKNPGLLHDLDLEDLPCKRIGISFYSKENFRWDTLKKADYTFRTWGQNDPNDPRVVIPNWISRTPPVWKNCIDKISDLKAILISRLDIDKWPSIENFIKICRHYQIPFDIAGEYSNKTNKKVLRNLKKLNVSFETLVGPINTVSFLSQNAKKYLFVAGVGQVVMEAAGLGFPTLVLSMRETERSAFLTADNLAFLKQWNFVINCCPASKSLDNLKRFFEQDRMTSEHLAQYSISELVYELCATSQPAEHYLRLVEGCSH